MGSIASMDLQLPSKCRGVSWPSPPTPNSKSFFQSEIAEHIDNILFCHYLRVVFENKSLAIFA